jgi:hypothetical protein
MRTARSLVLRRLAAGLLLALVPALLLAGCPKDCPDLAYPAMDVVTTGVDDPSLVRVTATVTGTANVAIDDGPLGDLMNLPGNTYDLEFTFDGTAIGTLDAVCTMGPLTGCTAEEHDPSEMPQVVVTQDATVLSVTLGRTGACPAD